jgi:ABC-type sugar transport system ATPase subunit
MIRVEQLSVRVGQFALEDASLEVPTGEHAFLMGKTGTGKTTLLEAVCGLRPIRKGRVRLMGEDVTHLAPGRRGIGFVPQDGALFSHLTVREHLTFALTVRQWPRADLEARVAELAEWLGLEPLLGRRPAGLSGGEAQRVALGRALSFRPPILCLDEPLSALDEETRAEMCGVLRTVRAHTGVTILHITHSLAEARKLADRILVLKDGRITLDGKPENSTRPPGAD